MSSQPERQHSEYIGDEEIPLQRPASTTLPSCCRVLLENSVSLLPHSESIVPARVERHQAANSRWGVLEPAAREADHCLDGLLVGRTLVDLDQPVVPVRVMNLTDQQHNIRKGCEIAQCQSVLSV